MNPIHAIDQFKQAYVVDKIATKAMPLIGVTFHDECKLLAESFAKVFEHLQKILTLPSATDSELQTILHDTYRSMFELRQGLNQELKPSAKNDISTIVQFEEIYDDLFCFIDKVFGRYVLESASLELQQSRIQLQNAFPSFKALKAENLYAPVELRINFNQGGHIPLNLDSPLVKGLDLTDISTEMQQMAYYSHLAMLTKVSDTAPTNLTLVLRIPLGSTATEGRPALLVLDNSVPGEAAMIFPVHPTQANPYFAINPRLRAYVESLRSKLGAEQYDTGYDDKNLVITVKITIPKLDQAIFN